MFQLSLHTGHQMYWCAALGTWLLGSAALCPAVRSDWCGQVETQTTGTVTHMPPELLMEGLLTKAGDVWAFGILMWWVHPAVLAGSPLPLLPLVLVCGVRQASLWCSSCLAAGAAGEYGLPRTLNSLTIHWPVPAGNCTPAAELGPA